MRRHCKWYTPIYSPVAQSVEQMAVNHLVRGSSPCWGARQIKAQPILVGPLLFFTIRNKISVR